MSSVKDILKHFICLAAAALLLELTIGNLPHWKTLSYTPISVSFERSASSGDAMVSDKILITDKILIPADPGYRNIGIDAYVINGTETWMNSMGESYATITSHVTDITLDALDADGRFICTVTEQRIGSLPGTKEYISFYLPSPTKYLSISFRGVNGTEIVCNSICYNDRIPLNLSPLRILIFFLIPAFFTLFCGRRGRRDNPLFQGSRRHPGTASVIAILAALCLNIFLILLLITVNPIYFHGNTGFEPYVHLARSLAKGQTTIDFEVSEELLAMKNPYDAAARSIHGVKFALDYAYYEGHYYVYFGIVPCLLLYLPYYLLTGMDLPNWCAVAFFAVLLALSIAYMLYAICKRYFPSVTLRIFLLEYEQLLVGSMLFYVLSDSGSYCIPMIASLTFVALGIACWVCAGDPSCICSNRHISLGSTIMALCAGCRPQLVLSAVLSYPLLRGVMLPKDAALRGQSLQTHIVRRRWLCFSLPFFMIAIPLMYYNYIRFGSVFEFGAKYNLTSTNIYDTSFSLERIPYGIFYYLLQVPHISPGFPFLESTETALTFPGIINYRNGYGGLLFWNLPIWFLFFFCITSKKTADRSQKDLVLMQRFLPVLGFLYLVVVTGMGAGGLIYRYCIDFVLFFSLSAVLLQLSIHENTTSEKVRSYLCTFLSICLFIAFCFQIACYLNGDVWPLRDADPDLYDRLADTITFWQ